VDTVYESMTVVFFVSRGRWDISWKCGPWQTPIHRSWFVRATLCSREMSVLAVPVHAGGPLATFMYL